MHATTKSKAKPKAAGSLRPVPQWQDEFEKLRTIILGCGLGEEVKWGFPCFTSDGRNVVLIQGFKEYCALLFFKGALLKDPEGILVKPGDNTQSSRQIRFTGSRDIARLKGALKAYIQQAIDVEQSGAKVKLKKPADFKLPEELQTAFKKRPALKTAFLALTPGRQRAYILHFSSAKQSATRASRIEKCGPQILAGKGLND